MKFSKSFDYDYQSKNVSNSLAVREAVTKLSLSPIETIKYLNNEQSLWSNSNDKIILTALKVLKQFYSQLQKDLNDNKDDDIPVNPNSLLRFLIDKDNETPKELILRKSKEEIRKKNWTNLKIFDNDDIDEIIPVPPSVPRLDENEFKAAGWSDSSEYEDKQDDDDVISYKSSSTSTTPINITEEEKLKRKAEKTTKNIMKIVHKVDKAISPRTPKKYKDEGNNSKISEMKTIRTSKAIQTDFEFIRPKTADASVFVNIVPNKQLSEESSSAATTTLNRFINKISDDTTPTSSSLYSSNLSAGEIPSKKITSKKKFTILTVEPDGSIKKCISNYQAYKQIHDQKHYYSSPSLIESVNHQCIRNQPIFTSTPIQKTTFLSNKNIKSTFDSNLSKNSSKIIPLAPCELSDSDAVATKKNEHNQCQHFITITNANGKESFPQNHQKDNKSSNLKYKIETIFDDNNDDDSTLNQISPLPSGD